MLQSGTLTRYLATTYLLSFLLVLFSLLSVVYLFDTVELMRRASKFDDISLIVILQMSLLKLPEVGHIVLPFVVLLSGILTLWKLTKRYELVVIRSAGLSIWQFLMPIASVAICVGVFHVVLINPIGSLFLGKFESLESTYLDRRKNVVTFSQQGLWLRQDNLEGRAILHASRIDMPDWTLKNVMALFYDDDNSLIRRIDAEKANLQGGEWVFYNATINAKNTLPQQTDYITLATDLRVDDIEDSFASPETISFWKMPAFIQTLETTGFDATGVRIHYQSLWSQPLLLFSMILLAACVTMRSPRESGTVFLVVLGVALGFVVFFMSSFMQALGASHQIPVFFAAWASPLICCLLGLTTIMSLEDG